MWKKAILRQAKRAVITLASVALLFGLVSCPAVSTLSQKRTGERIVAAQIHVLAGEDWDQVESELKRLKEAGFNTIILRVFQNSRDRYHQLAGNAVEAREAGVYFNTDKAPVVMDIVGPLARLCRRQELRLFAWMTTRRMDWIENKESWLNKSLELQTGKLAENGYYDLFNRQFVDYMLGLFGDLARAPVDGILLQDDLVIRTYEGFTESGIAAYRRFSGKEIRPEALFKDIYQGSDGRFYAGSNGSDFQAWCRFKSAYVSSVAEEIAGRCRSVSVNLKMALNVYYDTLAEPEHGIEWLGQSLDALAPSSFDYVCLMCYHRQIVDELELTVTEAIDLLATLSTELYRRVGDRMVLKLQAVDWQTREPLEAQELVLLLDSLRGRDRNLAIAPVEPGQIDGSFFRKALSGTR